MPPNVACSAVNTSVIDSPSACAFSRSMSRNSDGLVAVKVENTRDIRGSPLAARQQAVHGLAQHGRVLTLQRLELVFEAARG